MPAAGPERSFKAHYRRLVLGSIQRSAEAEQELQLALGHKLRARRAERRAAELKSLTPETAFAPISDRRRLQLAVCACWAGVGVYLLASLLLFGVHSWWTGGGDIALIALSFAWFFVFSFPRADQANFLRADAAFWEPERDGEEASG